MELVNLAYVLLLAGIAAAQFQHAGAFNATSPDLKHVSAAVKEYKLPAFTISTNFDGGNAVVLKATHLNDIHINMRGDPFTILENTTFYQRFMFRLTGVKGQPIKVTVENADLAYTFFNSSFPNCWNPLYKARGSYDLVKWFQVPTKYVKKGASGKLVFEVKKAAEDSIYLGYWPLYPISRMDDNVAKWQKDPRVRLQVVGKSVQGRDINLLTIGTAGKGKKKIWITAGQHPGEVQHLYWTEGFVNKLLSSPADAWATKILKNAVVYVGTNLNPDGIFLGLHRTNAKGYNLNRMWSRASLTTSPELVGIQKAMLKYGVDFFLDVHSDEGTTYNEMLYLGPDTPNFNSAVQRTQLAFDQYLIDASGPVYDLGQASAYDPLAYGPPSYTLPRNTNTLAFADSWTGNTFACASATVEMPFQDVVTDIHWETGWDGARSIDWGANFVEAIARALPWIRGNGPKPLPMYNATFYPSNPALTQFTANFLKADPLKL